jgi:hypothetical protein
MPLDDYVKYLIYELDHRQILSSKKRLNKKFTPDYLNNMIEFYEIYDREKAIDVLKAKLNISYKV